MIANPIVDVLRHKIVIFQNESKLSSPSSNSIDKTIFTRRES